MWSSFDLDWAKNFQLFYCCKYAELKRYHPRMNDNPNLSAYAIGRILFTRVVHQVLCSAARKQ